MMNECMKTSHFSLLVQVQSIALEQQPIAQRCNVKKNLKIELMIIDCTKATTDCHA